MAQGPKFPTITITGNGALAVMLRAAFGAIATWANKLTGHVNETRIEPGQGYTFSRDASGTLLDIATSGGRGRATSCPFTFQVVEGETPGNVFFRLRKFGSIDPVGLATNTFDTGDPWESAEFADSDTKWVRAHVMTDGLVPTSWEIEISDDPSPPIGVAEGTAPAEFWIDLAVYYNGTYERLVSCGHLHVEPLLSVVTDKALPECAESPTVNHYTWKVEQA